MCSAARLFLTILLLPPILIRAQDPVITPDTRATTEQFHAWLNSGQPRLVAWAASLAVSLSDAAALSELPGWLEHWHEPLLNNGSTGWAEQQRAIEAVLDALIQTNQDVPITDIRATVRQFPAQAFILASRRPPGEVRSMLAGWAEGSGSGYAATTRRIALMLLAKGTHPPGADADGLPGAPAVFASVVSEAQEEMVISVTAQAEQLGSLGMGGVCADYGMAAPAAGWPRVYTYDLVENESWESGVTIVDLDGDRIVARRFDEDRHPGSCYGVQPLDATTRHRLIAYWLGVPEREMTWQPIESQTIVWRDRPSYERQLGRLVEQQVQKLRETSLALAGRGIIPEQSAGKVMPRLIVTIDCKMTPCPLP